jgi:hypothetical protein
MICALVGLSLLLLALLAGPLRRPFLANWRFTVPAVLGFALGLGISGFLAGYGLPIPGWLMLVVALFCAVDLGAVGKAWLDENVGARRRDGER